MGMFSAILVPLGTRGLAAFQKEEAPRPESLYRTFGPLRLGILGLGLKVISHPRPPFGWGGAKGVPRLPRLGFPPWPPPSEAPPPDKGIPRGGHPSSPRRINSGSLRSPPARGPLGEGRAPHGPRGALRVTPFASVHPENLPSAPSRGLPQERKRPSAASLSNDERKTFIPPKDHSLEIFFSRK